MQPQKYCLHILQNIVLLPWRMEQQIPLIQKVSSTKWAGWQTFLLFQLLQSLTKICGSIIENEHLWVRPKSTGLHIHMFLATTNIISFQQMFYEGKPQLYIVIPNISETQSISKLAYSGFRFVSVLLLRSCKAAQLVFKAGLVAHAKVITVDFWQAKPPQYRRALSTDTAFCSTKSRQDSGLADFTSCVSPVQI